MTDHHERIASIRAFWDNQAKEHETGLAATTPDPLAKDLEIAALVRHLDPARDTLEMGCGNGVNIVRLLDHLRGSIVGVDYSETMIAAAKQAMRGNLDSHRVRFTEGDILGDLKPFGTMSQIFTDRCLINLPSLDLQIEALENLVSILRPGGRLVLIESVRQGQEKLNSLREMIGLAPIAYHWHNLYLDEPEFLARVPRSLRHVETDNFASLYFVISRVFNAKLTPEGQNPDYLAPINKIAAALPSFGDCAPLKLFQFEKIG